MKGTQRNYYSSRTDLQVKQDSQGSSDSTRQASSSQKTEADGANPHDDVTHWIGELNDSIRRHRDREPDP